MPTVEELARQELLRRIQSRQVQPIPQTMTPVKPTIRSALGNLMRDAVDASGIGGGYRQGLMKAAQGMENIGLDFTPAGFAMDVQETGQALGRGDLIDAGISALGVVPVIGDVAKKGAQTARSKLRDLYFLHNTNPLALARYDELGGLPAPSLAITKEDIPFENFGEITLIGRPERFAPEFDKTNTVWGSDAYTVRAPRAFRIPYSDAKDNFLEEFKNIEPSDRYDAEYIIEELSRHPSNPAPLYSQFDSWLLTGNGALRKFAEDANIPISKDANWTDLVQMREENRAAFDIWRESKRNRYFDPELYFDASSPSSTRVNIKPFTNKNIIPYMRRQSGAGTEETSTVGAGKIRAALQPRLSSLEEIRMARGNLSDDIVESNTANDSLLIDFQDALQPYYKWPDGGWQMRDDVGTALSNSGRMGMRSALEKEGFENVPDSLVEELTQFTNDLINSPTTYFEAKPMRQVALEEFAGALVPQNAPQSSLRLLESKGIPYTLYEENNPTDRLLARKRFKDSAFALGGLGLGAGAYRASQKEEQPEI